MVVNYIHVSMVGRSTFKCGVTVLMFNNESKVNIYTSSTFARDGTVHPAKSNSDVMFC